jgi:hypothetical protein
LRDIESHFDTNHIFLLQWLVCNRQMWYHKKIAITCNFCVIHYNSLRFCKKQDNSTSTEYHRLHPEWVVKSIYHNGHNGRNYHVLHLCKFHKNHNGTAASLSAKTHEMSTEHATTQNSVNRAFLSSLISVGEYHVTNDVIRKEVT